MPLSPKQLARNRASAALGGRPKGLKNKKTITKEIAKQYLVDRIIRAQDPLINAQLHIATGQTFLYKIEKEFIKTGTNKKTGEDNGYWRNLKPVLVETQEEIQEYLEGLIEEGDMHDDQDPSATYYYLTTKEPNNAAIDSLQQQLHGTPRQSIDHSMIMQFSLKDLAIEREKLKASNTEIPPVIIDIEVE